MRSCSGSAACRWALLFIARIIAAMLKYFLQLLSYVNAGYKDPLRLKCASFIDFISVR